MARTWIPSAAALLGCLTLTWLDAHNLFLLFPQLPFALALLLPLVPLTWEGLRKPARVLPLIGTLVWMLVLPRMPTSETKSFFLEARALRPGMPAQEVQRRMEPYLQVGVEYDAPEWFYWCYTLPGDDVLVFLSSPESGQVCEVYFGEHGVSRVGIEYVD